MEPLNQNWGALPGTVLESGPGPLEVGAARQELEAKMAIEQDKLRLQNKIAADKARKEKTGTDFTPVMAEHYGEYAADIERFNQETAMAIQAQERNPMNKDLDINNPSSAATLQLQSLQQLIQEKAHISESLEKMKAEDMKKFDAGEITAEDLAERNRYYTAPLKDHISGKLIPPPALGYYEYQKEYNDIIGGLQLDKTAYAGPGETGYIFSGTNEFIKPERIEQAARNMAANPASKQYEFKRRQLAKMQTVDPQGYDRIVEEAAKNRMSPEQYSTWEDLKSMASTRQTRTAGSDQTYNNMKGSGWGTEDAEADRLVRWMEGVSNNDPEVITELFGEITPVAGGQAPITLDGNSGFAKALQGVIVANKMDDGKPIPERVESITVHNGTVSVKTRGEDGSAGRVLKYKQEDFLSDFTEQLADNNPKIKRGRLYQVAQERGRIKESGYIESGKKPGLADEILAPSSKKGMMD